MYQVWLKSYDIYSNYRPETKISARADNYAKNWRNLPINNPKPDLHNINAHIKFAENPLMFTQVIIRIRIRTDGRTTEWRTDIPTFRHLLGIFFVQKYPTVR